ncbi:MAG: hypothetical protein JXM70_03980 [Pirellulales bacterium]|nr:hypothetical protein [Pirellulales bacterium]
MDKQKSSFPEPHRRLVELMQEINFGRIENMAIRNGQPVLSPPPRIVREVKFGAENGPRPEASIEEFVLRAKVVELFRYMDELQNGVIGILEIKHGLPFRMIFREDAA